MRYTVVLLWILLMSLTISSWPHYSYVYIDLFINNILGFFKPDWPLAALLMLTIVVSVFHAPLTRYIDRLVSAKWGDKQLDSPIKENNLKDEMHIENKNLDNNSPKITADELKRIGTYETVIEQFNDISNEIENPNVQYRDKEGVLKLQLATFHFFRWCEREYNLLWGTQIMLLEVLQSRKIQGMSILELDNYFSNVKTMHKEHYVRISDSTHYVKFLIDSGVVKIDSNGSYAITQRGIDFLSWLLAMSGYSRIKPY